MSHARQTWSERFAHFHAADQTVATYCAIEGISKSHFYYWKAKLAEPRLTPTPLVPIQLTATPMAPVVAAVGHIELVFPSGLLLRLPHDYAPEQLATLIASVEARSC